MLIDFNIYLVSEGCRISANFLTAYTVLTFSVVSDAFMYNKNAQTNNVEVPQFSYIHKI
jgi:hypothetical protein